MSNCDVKVCKKYILNAEENIKTLKKILEISSTSDDKISFIMDDLRVRIDKIMNTYDEIMGADRWFDLSTMIETQEELLEIESNRVEISSTELH